MTIYKGEQLIAGNTGYRPNIFDIKWSDHIVNDIQWLRGDTFSWQSGAVYVTAYNELLTEYNNASSTTETEGSITFKRTPKGYKIADATQETAILNKYNTDGIAWYYILDTSNTMFKLPRTKFGFEGLRGNVGDNIDESLPNITGTHRLGNASGGSNWLGDSTMSNGCFTPSDYATTATFANNTSQGTGYASVSLNASRSSSAYQDNAPVQERATQMYLYFYVGEYTQTAIEQTAGITTEQLNNKVDIGLQNFNTDNLNSTQKTYFSGIGMPSSQFINLTLGASGTTYTAPANGWLVFAKTSNNTNQSIALENLTKGMQSGLITPNSGATGRIHIPVKKDDEIQVRYTAAGTTELFRFIYAEGEQ